MEHKKERTEGTDPIHTRKCKHCQKEFTPHRSDKVHCSSTCRHQEWQERRNKFSHVRAKRKKAKFSDIMSDMITGLILSFGKGNQTEPKPEPKPEPPIQSNTYIIVCKKRERKGLLRWLLGLFW
jgi:hypothetical protein